MTGKRDERVEVVVAEGWAVFADGRQHSGGERVRVRAEVAEHWIGRGWAEPVTAPRAAP